ncbi:MAG: hypothetical protein L0H73_16170 [Nitrococcus sp.]|nr:hypothetical protein [Nitrococcus sp.]
MARRILTERMWQLLATMLPPAHGRQGRPAKNNRRFERWSRAGIWRRVLEELVRHADEEWLIIDATVVRAHKSFPVQK